MRSFFQFLNLIGDETSVVQPSDGFQYEVGIFDMYGAEFDYPVMPNASLIMVCIY